MGGSQAAERRHRSRAGRGSGGRPWAVVVALGLALLTWGCRVEWGGARLSLEDPVPPPEPRVEPETVEGETPQPLPEGRLVYLARLAGGTARLTPFARLAGPEGLAPLELPVPLSEAYRARFDSAFLRPGLELDLHAGGSRIGTAVVGDPSGAPAPGCPSVAAALPLLLPGQPAPTHAFAVPSGASGAVPSAADRPEPVRGMTVAGPVLAERLIGGDRAYLARRVSLRALRIPGDTLPAMAATYVVADSLAPGPPAGDAISLFFVARNEPARGFIPVWDEVRRYSTAADKEVLEYLDWIALPDVRLDFLRLVDGEGERLTAAARPPGDAEAEWALDWREAPGCRALERLRGEAVATARGAAAASGRTAAAAPRDDPSGGEAP